MKGLTHFLTGVCVATFFPMVVTSVYDPSLLWLSFLIPLGGLFGYLPDFLDFKFTRYLEPTDFTITPGYHELDPWPVATSLAEAINKAYTSPKPVNVKLQTLQMPNGLWRRYSFVFRLKEREVQVKIGPLITTGLEVVKGTEPKEEAVAVAKYRPNLFYSYEEVTNVDIWDGPTLQFRREGDQIFADFIQWHRRWSHSLTLGILFGLAIALVAGVLYSLNGILLSDLEILTLIGIVLGGMWGHVIVDQFGWLGSNLWWPITGKRKTGFGVTRSMDALGNFGVLYVLAMLMLWNLNRFAPTPIFAWAAWEFFLYYIIFPLAVVIAGVYFFGKKAAEKKTRKAEEMEEVSLEIAQPD